MQSSEHTVGRFSLFGDALTPIQGRFRAKFGKSLVSLMFRKSPAGMIKRICRILPKEYAQKYAQSDARL